jgi:hypothetical protein
MWQSHHSFDSLEWVAPMDRWGGYAPYWHGSSCPSFLDSRATAAFAADGKYSPVATARCMVLFSTSKAVPTSTCLCTQPATIMMSARRSDYGHHVCAQDRSLTTAVRSKAAVWPCAAISATAPSHSASRPLCTACCATSRPLRAWRCTPQPAFAAFGRSSRSSIRAS